jgi:hypothetical protein
MDIGTIIKEVEIVPTREEPFDPSVPGPSVPAEPVPVTEPAREPVGPGVPAP